MVKSQIEESSGPEMKIDSNSEMIIDELIAKIIQKDIVSDLQKKAKGIKSYIDAIESAM